MTLLIKAITRKWAFSISDRLLTQKSQNRYSPFDKASNKSIVFFPNDGFVTISYTGTAYIGNIPTDRWISEKLSNLDLPEGSDCILYDKGAKWTNLYYSIEKLIDHLNKEWPLLPNTLRELYFGILICGWHYTKSKPFWRPVLWYLVGNGTSNSPFQIKRHPKFWPERQIATVSDGVTLTSKENEKLYQTILFERNNGTEKSAEGAIVNELREVAKKHPTVGMDCMAVRMSYCSNPQVIINYYPDKNRKTILKSKNAPIHNRTGIIMGFGKKKDIPKVPPNIENMESYFSPWIISKHKILPPSSIIGVATYSIGNMSVVINGPKGPHGIIGGFISQKRPKQP